MKILDAHFHLNHLPQQTLSDQIERALCRGVVGGLVAGVWHQDGIELLRLRERTDLFFFERDNFRSGWELFQSSRKFGVFLSHGLHPTRIHHRWLNVEGEVLEQQIEKDLAQFETFVSSHATLLWAVGETGFDVSAEVKDDPRCQNLSKADIVKLQSRGAERCLLIAKQFGLPLIIHSRAAWRETLSFIERATEQGVKSMVHCYGGSAEELKKLNQLGVPVSFGGVPTWTKAVKVKESFVKTPLNQLLLETDSPDLPPEIDGQKPTVNEPALLFETAEILSKLKQVPMEELVEASNKNLLRYLGCEGISLN